jgi:hypothetical protein
VIFTALEVLFSPQSQENWGQAGTAFPDLEVASSCGLGQVPFLSSQQEQPKWGQRRGAESQSREKEAGWEWGEEKQREVKTTQRGVEQSNEGQEEKEPVLHRTEGRDISQTSLMVPAN